MVAISATRNNRIVHAARTPSHGGRGNDAAEQARHSVAASLPHGPARQVTDEIESREQQDDRPQGAGPEAVERAVGTGRQQRQNDERQYGELQCGRDFPLTDATDHLMDPRLLDQRQDHDRGRGAGEEWEPEAGRGPEDQHHERRHFRRPLDGTTTGAGRHHVGGDGERHGARQNRRAHSLHAARDEPAGYAAERSEQQEGASTGEPGLRARGVARPFTLDADGKPRQRGHPELAGNLEIECEGDRCLRVRRAARTRRYGYLCE
jgi:hypothetical protein